LKKHKTYKGLAPDQALDGERERPRGRSIGATSRGREPLISPRTIFKIMAVFVIPVTAGVLFVFFDPSMVFVITAALYASLWFLFNPFPALLLFMLLLAVRPQEGIASLEAIHVERLCAVLAMLGWGLRVAVERRIWPPSRIIASWFIAFVVVCFLSILTSIWKLAALNAWIELVKFGVLAFLISQLVNTPKRLFICLLVFGLGHVWMAAESLRLYYSEGYNYVRMGILRATTGSMSRGDPNALSASLVLAICLALYTIGSYRNHIWRILWFLVIGTGSVVVVLTGSRAAVLASLFLFFYIWLTSRKKLALGILLGAVVVIGWFAMPSQYQERFLTTFDFKKNPSAAESARGRITGIKIGTQILMTRPILGVGVGNFSVAHATIYSPEGTRSWLQAHNLFAELAGETGILGLITFAGFVIVCMRQAARVRSSLSSLSTPEATAIRALSSALLASFWLLLFFGLFAHNVMRYNWYLNAGLVSACVTIVAGMANGATDTQTERRFVDSG
jgi:O-antigen ligase